MDECYHKACDDLSMLTDENLEFLKKTTQAVVYTVNRQISTVGQGNYYGKKCLKGPIPSILVVLLHQESKA